MTRVDKEPRWNEETCGTCTWVKADGYWCAGPKGLSRNGKVKHHRKLTHPLATCSTTNQTGDEVFRSQRVIQPTISINSGRTNVIDTNHPLHMEALGVTGRKSRRERRRLLRKHR